MQLKLSQAQGRPEGYLDPQRIAQTTFTYPTKWELDSKELAAGQTVEDKEKIRRKAIHKAMLKVAAYVARAWKVMEDRALICCPYNFEYVRF